MRSFAVAALAVALVSSTGSAQEIGSEIPAAPVPAAPAATPGTQTTAPGTPDLFSSPPVPTPAAASVKAVAFGIRAGVASFGLFINTTGPQSATAVPTVGLTLWVIDNLALALDFGVGLLGVNGDVQFGFSALLGADYYFRSSADALRPLLAVKVGISKNISRSGEDFALPVSAGFGAAYFFSPSFSVDARLNLAFLLDLRSSAFLFSTVSPGVGASFYF